MMTWAVKPIPKLKCVPHGTEDLDGNLLDYKAPFTEPTRQAEHGKEASAFLQLCPVGSYDDRGIDLLVVSTPGKGGVESWSEDGLFNTTFPHGKNVKVKLKSILVMDLMIY